MNLFLAIMLLLLAAAGTLAAFGGDTWTKGTEPLLTRITQRGWVSLSCLVAALAIGVLKEVRSAASAEESASLVQKANTDLKNANTKLDSITGELIEAKTQLADSRKQVQRTAHSEIREALENILYPFEVLLMNAEYGPPKLSFRGAKEFFTSPDYMVSSMKAPEFVKAWALYKMKSNPSYPDIYPPLPWWEFFSKHANRNSAELDTIVQKYASHLDANILSAVHDLQKDDFFQL